jgi:GT2 family glycosyltransferase
MLVSILSLTKDRPEPVMKCYAENIRNCGVAREYLELLVADNGSRDARVVDYMKTQGLAHHRLNGANEGVGRAFNQLLARATGEFICLAGTDIKNQPGWLRILLDYAMAVPNAGIVGIRCTAEIPPLATRKDVTGADCHAHYLTDKCDKVFGTMLFNRRVLETVGGFYHGFHPYGFEDSDFNNRVNLAGFTSLYVPNWTSEHVAEDVGDRGEYRQMKDLSLQKNLAVFGPRHEAYLSKTLGIKCSLPEPAEPCMVEMPMPDSSVTVDLSEALKTPIGR